MSKNCCDKDNPRLNRVGGQAVLEGVMMKAGDRTVTSCRTEDGSIVVNDDRFSSVRKKHKILNIPILRGVVNFVEMLILSMKTLNASAEALGIEEEDGKTEKWLKKHLGVSLTDVIMAVALVLGLGLSVLLFMYLPTLSADGINLLFTRVFKLPAISPTVLAVIEGVMKVVIFITYLSLTSLMPDIKRTFMYHGAEHKSIACFEAGDELTPENAAKHRRFHPRCGTSYMFLMILLGIFAGMFVRNIFAGLPSYAYTGIRLLILPLIMGIGYEILMIAGKHDNFLTRAISAPGMWVQRITTKEPTPDMLEVAIVSIKCALRDEFPEFMDFWKEKGWEKKSDPTENEATAENRAEAAENEAVSENSVKKSDSKDVADTLGECASASEDTLDSDAASEAQPNTDSKS